MKGQYVKDYIATISEKYKTGQAKEHAYRPALQKLFEEITDLNVINDPKRSEYGAPDFVFLKGKTTVAYAETKDIGAVLDEVQKGSQLERYYGYSNLILTDYLEFRFFRNGKKYSDPIKVADLKSGALGPIEENFIIAEDTIKDFIQEAREPIKSGVVLAKVMAGKARRIRDNIKIFLKDGDEERNRDLLAVYKIIKELLLADLDYEKFADMYAQTLVYGLFVARYNDDSPENFTRQEARDLVPPTNPFLRHFFDHITGPSFDKRLEMIVIELCEEFSNADVKAIVHDYYKVEKDDSRDPIIHFYEDFLKEYDPKRRMEMGVFYTPLPIVKFIVKSIDSILKKDFGLSGLADATKEEIVRESQGKKYKEKVHKVQILDPATGTGTFLNEVIRQIKESFKGQEGRWQSYIKEDLIPRLYGFELMMAPYTIAHLKISSLLKESGADIGNERVGLYLTNSLEKGEKEPETLFDGIGLAKAITEESQNANFIKNKIPIMVVLGNPPYNISSQNKGEWILNLIKDYKKGLHERKINLDDDYIKFIRFAEYLIEKNGEGVIGMITNNSYIDGITHRQMRKKLLETFDDIYILDLHGNSKKKEKAPDGGKDENVFDIQQGVGISIFVKKHGKRKSFGKVHHDELYGLRAYKYKMLSENDIETIKWKNIDYKEPYYFFVPKDFSAQDDYDKNFLITDLFNVYSAGIKTKVDNISVDFDKKQLGTRVEDIITHKYTLKEVIQKFDLNPKTTWEYDNVLKINYNDHFITFYDYRPFDQRYVYYDRNFLSRSRSRVMDNFFKKDNVGIETSRVGDYIFISKNISDEHFVSDNSFKFPLYLYAADGVKIPNFNNEIYKKIIAGIKSKVEPENILDYIYACLHSPSYREKYKEFLKIDFPRVPYPKNEKQFFALAKLGEELRYLHLLESPKVEKFITTYSEAGENLVEKVVYKNGKVYINASQYFGGVPEVAWNFYIGGYQPAQKWLKDRKGRKLTNADIEHYQKIIVALTETDRLMKKIDEII